ncbi:hypothetical protein [Pedobacter agri]|uniref:hypothetical protein n=1 Tax=Pedobacter agri TaxID=454586 RepID=UPI00277FD820|nr:hypothetical protein [Pedobacter agri]MDQ1140097.1 hypothetical protein [Pedobacter agri]
MFDYISCTIINPQIAKSLLTDSRFSFKSIYNHKTKQWEDGNIAVFHQMKIYVYSNGRIIFKGSLHKLYNGIYTNCAWNHDQFDFSKVSIAVDFFRDLNLDPSELKLSNYEVGHNLHLNISCKDFLNSLICYKSKSFHEMRAANLYCINGKDCYLDEYAVKIYDKGLQYNFNIDNLLRIEKKIRKIRNSGRQFLTLADVLDKSFWKECQNQLIDIIEDFIIVEPTDQNLNRREFTIL